MFKTSSKLSKVAAFCMATLAVGSEGCAHSPQQGVAVSHVTEAAPADDRLRADDVIEVRVVGEAEMSGEYRVGPDGHIQFPYAGSLRIAGLQVEQVHELLTSRLREEYLRNPQVAVHVKDWNSRRLSVLGEVNKPGPIAFFTGMTLVDAIAAAGGFTKSAAPNSVTLRRETAQNVQSETHRVADINAGRARNVAVLPGDLIIVQERMF